MKKLFVAFLMLVLILTFTGCNQPKQHTEASVFSYSEHAERYKDDLPGIKHYGFFNTDEFKITSAEAALERAKKECTIEWNTSHVSYDKKLNVWMVEFYTEGLDGGDQCVYLDSNGKTLLIVYGE